AYGRAAHRVATTRPIHPSLRPTHWFGRYLSDMTISRQSGFGDEWSSEMSARAFPVGVRQRFGVLIAV
ncbi:MAG TPA: hypothetical protein VG498_19160, partial [Terriglobales bacterium]|nr:hypothetical protein [Terriglobales bacterium]